MSFNSSLTEGVGRAIVEPICENRRFVLDKRTSPLGVAAAQYRPRSYEYANGWEQSGVGVFLRSIIRRYGGRQKTEDITDILLSSAIREAALNAVQASRTEVDVQIDIGRKGVFTVFSDDGPGFDFEKLGVEAPKMPVRESVWGGASVSHGCGLWNMHCPDFRKTSVSLEVWFSREREKFRTLLLFRADLSDVFRSM